MLQHCLPSHDTVTLQFCAVGRRKCVSAAAGVCWQQAGLPGGVASQHEIVQHWFPSHETLTLQPCAGWLDKCVQAAAGVVYWQQWALHGTANALFCVAALPQETLQHSAPLQDTLTLQPGPVMPDGLVEATADGE